MKKGEPPSMEGSSWRPGGCRNRSTSWPRANCGMRVSSLVLTITVRSSVGSVCAKDASVDLPFVSVCLQRTDQSGQPGARHHPARTVAFVCWHARWKLKSIPRQEGFWGLL